MALTGKKATLKIEVPNLPLVVKKMDWKFLEHGSFKRAVDRIGSAHAKPKLQDNFPRGDRSWGGKRPHKAGALQDTLQEFTVRSKDTETIGGVQGEYYGRMLDQGTVFMAPKRSIRRTRTQIRAGAEKEMERAFKEIQAIWSAGAVI
jgi:hypothetical protein